MRRAGSTGVPRGITEKEGKGGVIWGLKLALGSIYRIAVTQKVANTDSRLC